MKENFDAALKAILHHEGGYVNHKLDPGGRTNLGCTQRVWEEWVGHPVTEQDMRDLTPADVAPLYKAKYWDRIRGDDLPTGVDYIVFDAAINSGPGRAAKWLQQTVGAVPDGAIGAMKMVG
jgi:lysozyme family protein